MLMSMILDVTKDENVCFRINMYWALNSLGRGFGLVVGNPLMDYVSNTTGATRTREKMASFFLIMAVILFIFGFVLSIVVLENTESILNGISEESTTVRFTDSSNSVK